MLSPASFASVCHLSQKLEFPSSSPSSQPIKAGLALASLKRHVKTFLFCQAFSN